MKITLTITIERKGAEDPPPQTPPLPPKVVPQLPTPTPRLPGLPYL